MFPETEFWVVTRKLRTTAFDLNLSALVHSSYMV
jgi:hypothetical protein